MKQFGKNSRVVLLRVALLAAHPFVADVDAGQVETFSDIAFWVGDGSNRAALAIDWDGHAESDHALVWGFQWDGAATTIDMLTAILTADSRLYAKIGAFGNGAAVFGIGYDGDGDGTFELDDGTQWDAHGIAKSSPADLAMQTQPDDLYREGWFLGYWHHAVGMPGDWSSGLGVSNRALSDGDWDSLAYKDTTDTLLAPPSLLIASEQMAMPGDFDRNGTIDASDFTIWRDSVGTTPSMNGYGADGNLDGSIDAGDYEIWTSAFQHPSSGQFVPEPDTGIFAWTALILIFAMRKYL